MRVLVLDIGGTSVKVYRPGRRDPVRIQSSPAMTPKKLMKAVNKATEGWTYDVVSIGFPGPVMDGKPLRDPAHLGEGWVGFDFGKAFGLPVKVINDAAMQALGSYRGGRMLFLGLGTGLGSALIVDGALEAMELAHLPYKHGKTFEHYVSTAALERLGGKKWLRNVHDVVAQLKDGLQAEYVVLGGGNAKRVSPLPPDTLLGSNENAREGGLRLWQGQSAGGRGRVARRAPGSADLHASKRELRRPSRASQRMVFLFDVDNTLLDNDRIAADLKYHLEREIGHEGQERYWAAFEKLREQVGYADYLGALQLCRASYPREQQLLVVSHFLLEYPFAECLYPNALSAVEHARRFGRPVILSDGDVAFQPHKVWRSGLYDAFEGDVLIYIHKELELDDVALRYPSDHYVLIDDKIRILSAVKKTWGRRVTTVFPRQGHYALDERTVRSFPAPDFTIQRIGDLVDMDFHGLAGSASVRKR